MNIEWDDEVYATGYEDVDNDHKRIIGVLNDLLNGLKEGAIDQTVTNTLAFLEEYTLSHFRREEKVMEEMHCGGRNQNKREHMDFERQISNFKMKFDREGINKGNLREFLVFIAQWISNHIQKTDILLRSTLPRGTII